MEEAARRANPVRCMVLRSNLVANRRQCLSLLKQGSMRLRCLSSWGA